MSITALTTFAIACFFIVIVPGPTVTVIIANSLRDGVKAGLLNVAGTQFGLILMMLVVALSLNSVVMVMAEAFFWLKLAGAAYLVWLGVSLLRSDGRLMAPNTDSASVRRAPRGGYFWQGFVVIWSNPKALLLFGAFIPQFIDPAGGAFGQTMLLGLIFMAVATVFDSLYALMAGSAGAWLTHNRVRLVEKMSGLFLIGGGIWLASLKRA